MITWISLNSCQIKLPNTLPFFHYSPVNPRWKSQEQKVLWNVRRKKCNMENNRFFKKAVSLQQIINNSVSDWYTNSECCGRKLLATLRLHQTSAFCLVIQLWNKSSQTLCSIKEFGYFLNYILLIIHFPEFPPLRINTPFSRNWSVIFLTCRSLIFNRLESSALEIEGVSFITSNSFSSSAGTLWNTFGSSLERFLRCLLAKWQL